jgi:peptidoglycan/LPS O-acetylase OafA/YrhL
MSRQNFIKQFDVLDFYRYAGAVLVAIDHYMILYLPIEPTVKSYIHSQLQPLMGFFFTLSGFVIMHVYAGRISLASEYLDYLQKRLARMYPLHIITFLAAPHFAGFFFPEAIIPNILLVHAWNTTHRLSFDYPSWSVSAEFFVYLLFPVFLYLIIKLGKLSFMLPFAFGICLAILFYCLNIGSWQDATYNFGCLRAVPSFISGMIVYQLATNSFATLRVPAWIAHGSAAMTLPLMLCGTPRELMLIVMAFIVFLLARTEPRVPGILSKPIPRALANASYGFYLLHALVGPFVFGHAIRNFHVAGNELFAVVPLAIATTTGLAILSFGCFENPARRFLSNVRFLRRDSKSLA